MGKREKTGDEKNVRKDRISEVANTFEWLITAFILAFVFRAFIMEAYRIPTGSMADTLMGAHFRLRCPQCGYKYNFGFIPERFGLPTDTIPSQDVPVGRTRCPSCGYYQNSDRKYQQAPEKMAPSNGDRILVLKCIYQFFEPKQWDVIVFKDPTNPTINFIKRLIGRPGETVEIIDGDVYINGQISRKPPKVQNELWRVVYNNDYQPIRPAQGIFNGHIWRQPFDFAGSDWQFVKDNPALCGLESNPDKINYFAYDTSAGNGFKADCPYNGLDRIGELPYCSDLMTRFYVRTNLSQGCIGVSFSKYQTVYKGWVDFSGKMVISKISDNSETVLVDKQLTELTAADKPALLKFSNVDHELVLEYGKDVLKADLGRTPDAAGQKKRHFPAGQNLWRRQTRLIAYRDFQG